MDQISLHSPDSPSQFIHQVLTLKGLSLFLNVSSVAFSDLSEEGAIVKEKLADSQRCVLKEFGLSVDIQGHLCRIEDRKRDLDSCLKEVSLPSSLHSQLFSLSEDSYFLSSEHFLNALNLSIQQKMEWKEEIDRLIELMSTPLPLFQLDVCMGSIDLNISKRQLDFLARLLPIQNSPKQNPVPRAVQKGQTFPEKQKDQPPAYEFGVLSFVLHLVNGLFSCRWLFFYVMGVFLVFPLLFFHPFYFLALLLPLLFAVAIDWICLSRRYFKLNSSINPSFHSREQFAVVSARWNGLHLSLTDDCITPSFEPLSLCISPLLGSFSLGKNMQSLHFQMDAISIIDGVSSREKGRQCFFLSSTPISMNGEILAAKYPLFLVDIRRQKEDISISAQFGDLNCVVSPCFILSVFDFLPLQLLSFQNDNVAPKEVCKDTSSCAGNESLDELTATSEESLDELTATSEESLDELTARRITR